MQFFFYFFATLVIISALGVILNKNPVYSVLFLIFTFLNTAGLFILIGAEFIALLLVVVYVGAVAVLFLFVVMMLNVDLIKIKEGLVQKWPAVLLISCILLFDLLFMLFSYRFYDKRIYKLYDASALADVLYTDYFYIFQSAGVILLSTMIGVMSLTLRKNKLVKRQSISAQIISTSRVTYVKIKPWEPIK